MTNPDWRLSAIVDNKFKGGLIGPVTVRPLCSDLFSAIRLQLAKMKTRGNSQPAGNGDCTCISRIIIS